MKNKRLVTYWEFSPLPRKVRRYEPRPTRSSVFAPFILMGSLGALCLVSKSYRTDGFSIQATEQPLVSPYIEPAVSIHTPEGEGSTPRVDWTEPSPSPAPEPKQDEVTEYIKEVFGKDAHRALGVAKCESGLRKNAINDKNRNKTVDYGVFQINSVHIKTYGNKFTTDWKENVRVAKKIFDKQGFRPWVCAHAIGEKNYLSR